MARRTALLDFSDHAAAAAFFDEAWQHPRRHYVVQPVDVTIARDWLGEYASMRHFGWVPAERPPMVKGDLLSLDTLYYRNRCGWQADTAGGENNGYLCDAPPDEHSETCSVTGKRLCHTWQCPVAYAADREDVRKRDPLLWKTDFRDYPDDTPEEWMVLNARPRYAYVANVRVLGVDDESEAR